MKCTVLRRSLWTIATGLLFLPASLLAQEELSHARVVRLSYLSGTVAIQRPGSTQWAKAMVNTPIQEGFALSTSENSFAEVEFENGSTARVGELSKLDFSQLALNSEGNKLNRLAFEQGYATFHFIPQHSDVYAVKVADTTITPNGKSEFRTDFNNSRLRVEVFNGSVAVATASETAKLGKDRVLEYNPQTTEAFNIRQGVEKDSWDKWVDARDTQSQLALRDQAVRVHRSIYGWDDLGAYGDWAYIPGYGNGWAPYAPLGWSPYSMGMWDWYPSFGWTWISGEPWGWLPYHYGLWNFDPVFGWFWMPGNFGFWSPARVTWYTGPGWIGWRPVGVPVHPGLNGMTAVPTNVVQTGQPINSQSVIRVQPGQGTPTNRLSIQPTVLATLPGVPVARAGIEAGSAFHASTSAAFRARSTPAPATVLMGGDPAAEKAFIDRLHNFGGRNSGGSKPQPLRAHLGTTLGGHFPVAGGPGVSGLGSSRGVRGIEGGRATNAPRTSASSPGSSRPGPMVLSHGGHESAGMMRGGSAGTAHGGGGGSSSGMSNLSHASSGMSSGGHSSSGGRH